MSIKVRVLGLGALLAGFMLGGGVSAVRADTVAPGSPSGTDATFFFDESGNGFWSQSGSGPFTALTSVVEKDPSDPSGGNVLVYFLPSGITVGNGDVEASEPGSSSLSDVIRFTDASGNLTGTTANLMIFYSDTDDSGTALADTGFPSNLGSGAVASVNESGPEGANGFSYTASVTGGGSNTFNATSDGTLPEPGTLLLLGSGLLSVVGFVRKKNWLQ